MPRKMRRIRRIRNTIASEKFARGRHLQFFDNKPELTTMKIYSAALIGAAMLGAMAASPAHAITVNPNLSAPSAVEDVACRTVVTTTWRNGRRVQVRRTVCDQIARPRPRCQTVRERIVRPSGRVVWQTRQVCRRF
jgi:hypothetical protein